MFYIMTHSSVRIPLSTKYRDNRVEERREDVESEVEGKWTDNLFSLIRMMRLTARLCSDWGRRSQWHTHTQRRDNRQLSVSATCIITSRDRERRDSCWKAQKGGERQKTRAKHAKSGDCREKESDSLVLALVLNLLLWSRIWGFNSTIQSTSGFWNFGKGVTGYWVTSA